MATQTSPNRTTTRTRRASTATTAKARNRPVVKAATAPTPQVRPSGGGTEAREGTKGERTKKIKLVRDGFTMPKDEFAQIEVLKQRAMQFGKSAKKSEILRAAVKALAASTDAQLQAALAAVPSIKTGRPKKSKD